jgi:hypothetical protein
MSVDWWFEGAEIVEPSAKFFSGLFFYPEVESYICINQLKQNHMKSILSILGFAACLILAILTATGDVQKVVHFNGVANEIAFCLIWFTLAFMLMMSEVLPDKSKSKPELPQKNRF